MPFAPKLALAAALLLGAPAAAADAPPCAPAPDTRTPLERQLDAADAAFGKWVVGPLATVMFFDVWFWDASTRPLGEGVGESVGGEDITRYEPGVGYTYQRRCAAPADQVNWVIEGEVTRTVGSLMVGVRRGPEGALEAELLRQPAPPELVARLLAGQPPAPPAVEGQEAPPRLATVDSLAPFPVTVDLDRGELVPQSLTPDRAWMPLVAGAPVTWQDQTGEVVEAQGDQVVLRLAEARVDQTPLPNPADTKLPFVVAWLVLGAIFFTLRMSFISVRGFAHALKVITGAYDKAGDTGEISHFQALASALSATVGLGNIAGVALAVAAGGPGAVFWMIVAALFGMSSKFVECTLGQMYREVRPDGSVSGGPMHYLDAGLQEMGLGALGKPLAVLFAVMCVGGSFGGGNMFQANQSFAAISEVIPFFADKAWLYGLVLAFLVGLVVVGGIRRIGTATSVIVPFMCGLYLLAGVWVLIVHAADVPAAVATIVRLAFTPEAGYGGFIGVLVQGFRRASFSNEAGVGSASIAHSAAATSEPVREGIVALLEPFIDTVIVCAMTGIVVVVTGAYTQGMGDGVQMTSWAFGSVVSWFPTVLSAAVFLFAFSTMISWSYYGERCTVWLLGERAILPYRLLFLVAVFCGSVFKLGNVLDFSDLMILGMAFPNILGAVLLSGKVKAALDDYMGRLASGAMKPER